VRSAPNTRHRRWVGLGLASLILILVAGAAGLLLGHGGLDQQALAQEGTAPTAAPEDAAPPPDQVPGGALGNVSDSDFWREIRGGIQGTVSIPDKKAGVLVQSSGEGWRAARNGPLSEYGGGCCSPSSSSWGLSSHSGAASGPRPGPAACASPASTGWSASPIG
jgi:hypothetical protein